MIINKSTLKVVMHLSILLFNFTALAKAPSTHHRKYQKREYQQIERTFDKCNRLNELNDLERNFSPVNPRDYRDIDYIVVRKRVAGSIITPVSKMYSFSGDQLVRIDPVTIGWAGYDIKEIRNDGKTPEGIYKVTKKKSDKKNGENYTPYKRAFEIDYPNKEDIKFGRINNLVKGNNIYKLGDAIQLHGTDNKFRKSQINGWNWSIGCVAMENAVVLELYPKIASLEETTRPTVVEICPAEDSDLANRIN